MYTWDYIQNGPDLMKRNIQSIFKRIRKVSQMLPSAKDKIPLSTQGSTRSHAVVVRPISVSYTHLIQNFGEQVYNYER